MIANQSNIVSLRGYYRKKSLKTSPPPDLSLACVSPYAARAGCGRQTCSYREGTRSSPRSSRGGTWCAPWGTSGACSPGRSRGRSAVGRRHLEFQVAGLRPGMGGEREAGQKVSKSMAAHGLIARDGMRGIAAICCPGGRDGTSNRQREAPAPAHAHGRLAGPALDPAGKLIMGITPPADLAGWKTKKYFSWSIGNLHSSPSSLRYLCHWPNPSYWLFSNYLSRHWRAIGWLLCLLLHLKSIKTSQTPK